MHHACRQQHAGHCPDSAQKSTFTTQAASKYRYGTSDFGALACTSVVFTRRFVAFGVDTQYTKTDYISEVCLAGMDPGGFVPGRDPDLGL